LDQDTLDTFKRKAQESVKPADFDPILRDSCTTFFLDCSSTKAITLLGTLFLVIVEV